MTSSDGINDNVNIYDNNNRSFNKEISINNETEKKIEKKNLNITKDSYFLNNNFKNNYYPTDFNLNLSSEIIKNNNINSVANINQKLNLSNLNLNNDVLSNKNKIQSKDDTVIIKSEEIDEIKINKVEINPIIKTNEIKYKLNNSKSLVIKDKKNNIFNSYFNDDINIFNKTGIFFINKNNFNELDNNTKKIKFGFKYEKIQIKIEKNILEKPLSPINKENTITFTEKKINKSQNNNYIMNNNILNTSTEKEKKEEINEEKKHIQMVSKSQKDLDQIKLNYINDKYFEANSNNNINNNINNTNNTNIINNNNTLIKEIFKEKENIDNNINLTHQANNINIKINEEEKKITLNDDITKKDEASKNILDLDENIEEADLEEEASKKINDTKSIMSNYIISPLMGPRGYQRSDLNSNFRESKENFYNFNIELMSNKGSAFPLQNISNYNETEIEIMNENEKNGKEFSSFIETPRASGNYNKRFKYKNENYNMNNTYNIKSMNLKMKKLRDKINQNAKEIQQTNERINKLDEQIKEYENFNKQYDMWIEKEEEESEMLINMLNFLNNNNNGK